MMANAELVKGFAPCGMEASDYPRPIYSPRA